MMNKIFRKGSKSRKKLQDWYYKIHIPSELSRNFIHLDDDKQVLLRKSLVENAFGSAKALSSPDVEYYTDVLATRFNNHRSQVIPWLNSVKPLKGLRILEIGCGNGTSTVALAEQGAIVTAIDIEEGLLKDAEERCRVYGVKASFRLLNANEVATSLAGEEFDMIMFFAVLEHMTYDERQAAILQTYNMLAPGGLWSVIGTPNRLHYFDSHTAMLPFYFWLPDELAMKYASFSPRPEFADRFGPAHIPTDEQKLEFARWGRGMSYHELELALGPLQDLKIVSSLAAYLKKRDLVYRTIHKLTNNGRYSAFFRKFYPQINAGFFDPYLDLIIEK